MDLPELEQLLCHCGKRFLQQNSLTTHRRSCAKSKSRVAQLLQSTKRLLEEKRETRKRRKLEALPQPSPVPDFNPGEVQNDQAESSYLGTGPSDSLQETIPDPSLDMPLAQRRSRRKIQLPAWFDDMVPQPSTDSDDEPDEDSSQLAPADGNETPPSATPSSNPPACATPSSNLPTLQTTRDSFNLFRVFRSFVGRSKQRQDSPINDTRREDLQTKESTSAPPSTATSIPYHSRTPIAPITPYPNMSSFLLGEHYWNSGKQKSQKDFMSLVRLLTHPEFSIDDIRTTPWGKIDSILGSSGATGSQEGHNGVDWIKEGIRIQVPFHSRLGVTPGPREYYAGEFHRKSIVAIIHEKLSDPTTRQFHFNPYELYWQPGPSETKQRVYGELYSSPAFVAAHEQLQNSPPEPGCELPRVVIGLMFASDETHLTQFGSTKLWPVYMFFGNESKYRRCKPSEHLCHHIAYFTKLSDAFKDFVTVEVGAKRLRPTLAAYCVRALFHAQWELILDEEFIHAFVHGIVVACFDGVLRRCYPRIFTYSADYKEKIILAGIRSLALCPCPRCLIPKKEVKNLGTPSDRQWRSEHKRSDTLEYRDSVQEACTNLLQHNFSLDGQYVDKLLKQESLSAVENAFSKKLSAFGFDLFSMLVVDQMHEIESGNWKALFIHLLRILQACDDPNLIHSVDIRYRAVPTFRKDTIRKFRNNVTEMKNLAARDWADMLQCALPVFEGLFPEPHNTAILDLLFTLAHWHGLAKLRLHTSQTLELLDLVTTDLGVLFRQFQSQTCPKFNTQELPKEVNARYRRLGATKAASSTSPINTAPSPTISNAAPSAEKSTKGKSLERTDASATASTADKLSKGRSGRKAGSRPTVGQSDSLTKAAPSATAKNKHSASATCPAPSQSTSGSSTSFETTRNACHGSGVKKGKTKPGESVKPLFLESTAEAGSPTFLNQEPIQGAEESPSKAQSSGTSRKAKSFNLITYKFHAFGDYVETIRTFGTTDSYSTEPGELEHRTVKNRFARTSKRNYVKQLTDIERKQVKIQQIRSKLNQSHGIANTRTKDSAPSASSTLIEESTLIDALSEPCEAIEGTTLIPHGDFEKPSSALDARYVIGKSENESVHLSDFLRDNAADPAIKGFLPNLKEHLLQRIIERGHLPGGSQVDTVPFFFEKDRLYLHRMLRLNYTTYDIRRDEDIVNPNSSHCNVMMLAPVAPGLNGSQHTANAQPPQHPYIYARILSIFHVNIACGNHGSGSKAERFDVLWVRWYQHHDPKTSRRLDRLTFVPMKDEHPFGFVDPGAVLRSCHIVPAMSEGRVWAVSQANSKSPHAFGLVNARSPPGTSKLARDKDDWKAYYLNRFADRDMLMRFHWGMGIGHSYWSALQVPELEYRRVEEHQIESRQPLPTHQSNEQPERPQCAPTTIAATTELAENPEDADHELDVEMRNGNIDLRIRDADGDSDSDSDNPNEDAMDIVDGPEEEEEERERREVDESDDELTEGERELHHMYFGCSDEEM